MPRFGRKRALLGAFQQLCADGIDERAAVSGLGAGLELAVAACGGVLSATKFILEQR